ncbi:MAG TPA: TonB family protein [Paracoccaceae bacterium]|nr:TonB family protein [Paracoccaceae bacterium]
MAVPVDAPDEEMQGSVTVAIAVYSTGHVAACSIIVSSGIAALDETTCDQLTSYIHYSPALDDAGDPTASSDTLTVVGRFHHEDSEPETAIGAGLAAPDW